MWNILIINAHEYYPFSEGRLNRTLAEKGAQILSANGYALQTTTMKDDYDVAIEQEKHEWADVSVWRRSRHSPATTSCRTPTSTTT